MVWGRQWFHHNDQIGLSDFGIELEHNVRTAQFDKCLTLINNFSHLSGSSRSLDATTVFFLKRQINRISKLQKHRFCARKLQNSFKLRIAFIDFWNNFNPRSSPLYGLFAQIMKGKILLVDAHETPDIVIGSCFGTSIRELSQSSATHILYLGENLKPNYSFYDYSFSFEHNHYFGRNLNLPLWFLSLKNWDHENDPYLSHPLIMPELICNFQQVNRANKKNSICVVANNFPPARAEQIALFRSRGIQIDIYGNHFNPVIDKVDTMSKYKYCLCGENSWNKGYVTEKLIHAYHSGAKPIYWGGVENEKFNTNEFISLDEDNSNLATVLSSISQFEDIDNRPKGSLLSQQKYLKKKDRIETFVASIINDLYIEKVYT